jgi:hypothetical protein
VLLRAGRRFGRLLARRRSRHRHWHGAMQLDDSTIPRHRVVPVTERVERAPVRGMIRVHRKCGTCGRRLGFTDEPEW